MSRITDITRNELSHYFNMPIAQAAKEFNVGVKVLKKKSTEFGIPRWPHRKIKSLEFLINNIQELGQNNGRLTNDQLRDTVQILQEQKRLMEEMPKPDPLTL
ncbi:hypothetical protein SUGI_0551550 [Cryptomeria japonica]|nr:hypothetical protein SUGI_0551550 [Cryptomeria japonica]